MPENFVDICVLGVVSSLTYRFVGETQRMIDFCSIVNQQNKPICYRQIGAGVSEWDKDKSLAKVECNKIPDSEGRNWCLEVI